MSMNPTAIVPVATAGRRTFAWWILPAIGLVVVAAIALWIRPWGNGGGQAISGQFFAVAPMDLEVKINKDGELQAVSYTDIKSEVESVTQIITIVPEGTTVKKGDVLITLDSLTLRQKKEQLDLDLRKAESNRRISSDMKDIQESQNQANKEVAEVALQLAQLDLKQYQTGNEGTYPQSVENAKTALSMSRLNLKNFEEDLEQTKVLFTKGFVTASDVKKSELAVTTGRNEVQKATTAMLVLEKYTHRMDMAKLNSAFAQAEQKLYRTLKENASTLNQKYADLEEKQESLALLQRQARKLDEQLAACTIRAPEDGLVIYSSSIERREREPIQEGTQVRQSQWLLRLPDVTHMKVLLKVQEAWKPRLRVENAEIFISRLDQVIAIPLAAIYTVGRDSFVFVRNGQGVKERKVQIGTANETHVQIANGLAEGEQILLLQPGQGRMLLEKAGIKVVEQPSTRPARGSGGRKSRGGESGQNAPAGPDGPSRNGGGGGPRDSGPKQIS